MKKVLSITVVIVMAVAMFAAAVTVHASELAAYSVDWYAFDGAVVKNDGHCEEYVNENHQTYTKNPDVPAADIVGFLGWADLGEDKIAAFGYKLDNGAAVFSNEYFSKVFNAAFDRTAELTAAGRPNGEGFWITFYYNNLLAGDHTAKFLVKGEDGEVHEIFSYTFTVVGEGGEAIVPEEGGEQGQPGEQGGEQQQGGQQGGEEQQGGQQGGEQQQGGQQGGEQQQGGQQGGEQQQGGQQGGNTNPNTADASVIAIAAVAVVALAGVVAAKKVK